MGQAICAGLLHIDGVDASSVTVANPGAEKRQLIEDKFAVRTVAAAVEGLPADTIILAVKPAKVAEVAAQLAQAGIGNALVISIAAGVSTDKIAAVLGENAQIVRVMPNTPLLCGCGMSGVSGANSTPPEATQLVCELFSHMGSAVIVPEEEQDIVTAVSGSGPAYFELFAETIARAAEELGMSYETSLQLALQTMLGTAKMIDETHQDLPSAIKAVSSPGGTTVAALDAMRCGGLETALSDGVKAAAKRSAELGA